MDPTSRPTPSFETSSPQISGELPSLAPEQASKLESSGPAPAAPVATVPPTAAMPQDPQAQVLPQPPLSTPPVADDLDLIEKEWVEKAKDIVHKTRSDPHTQNKEMNRFKADYMKKRYNKDIKLSE